LRYRYTDKYKIGFSAYPPQAYRVEQIQETAGKDVRFIHAWMLYRAKRHEARLHRKFGDKRFTFKGSGKTEWFRLNWVELALITIDLGIRQWIHSNIIYLLIAFILAFSYIVFSVMSFFHMF